MKKDMGIHCEKCYHFKPLHFSAPGGGDVVPASCDHSVCWKKIPEQTITGDIVERQHRVKDIIDLNLTGECTYFEPFVIQNVSKKWLIFSYTVKEKVRLCQCAERIN